jgi:thaumarchaeosortase
LALLILLPALPILFTSVESFETAWFGRGLLGIGLVLYLIHFFDIASGTSELPARRLAVIATVCVVVTAVFTVVRGDLTSSLWPLSARYVSQGWLSALDLGFYAAYLSVFSVAVLGARDALPLGISLSYLGVNAAAFAYDLQYPFSTSFVWPLLLIATVGSHAIGSLMFSPEYSSYIGGNTYLLKISGESSSTGAIIGWPCAGFTGLVLFGTLFTILMSGSRVTRRRKVVYATLGLAGTLVLNMWRIAFILYASLTWGWEIGEVFHSIGYEFVFVGWLVLFMGLVVLTESGRLSLASIRRALLGFFD